MHKVRKWLRIIKDKIRARNNDQVDQIDKITEESGAGTKHGPAGYEF